MKNFINAARDFFATEDKSKTKVAAKVTGVKATQSSQSNAESNPRNPYLTGYSDYVVGIIKQRTVELYANFLLPYLKGDMTILDCGCGPGSITVGLAKKLNDGGKIIGVDIEPSQVNIATAAAAASGVDNASFQVGDILHLPFEDETFDAVYSSAVLHHLPNPTTALKEMRRVIKNGGIIAVTEPDHSSMIIYPEIPMVLEAKLFREKVMFRNGANPKLGRKLRCLLMQSGFRDIVASVNSFSCADRDNIMYACEYLAREWAETAYGKAIIEDGTATIEQIRSCQQAWYSLARIDYAFIASIWGTVLGWK